MRLGFICRWQMGICSTDGLMRRTHTCEGVRKIGFHRFGAAHLCSGLSSWTTVEGGAGRRRGAQSRTCDTPNRWRSWEWACATRRWLQWPARVRGWRAPRATTFPRGCKMLVYAGTIRSLPFLPVCLVYGFKPFIDPMSHARGVSK